MDVLLGKKLTISGMTIEILADDGEHYLARNLTTGKNLSFDKQMIQKAIRLGKAEEHTGANDPT